MFRCELFLSGRSIVLLIEGDNIASTIVPARGYAEAGRLIGALRGAVGMLFAAIGALDSNDPWPHSGTDLFGRLNHVSSYVH